MNSFFFVARRTLSQSVNNRLSGLSYIQVKSLDPFELFKAWRNEVKRANVSSNLMCLATATK